MDQFADIEGPLPIGLWPVILQAAGILTLILFACLLLYWWLKRPRKAKAVSREPVRSPLEIALDRLTSLGSAKEEIAPEPFTVEVSDIVRDYLEEALEIPAREQTSEEFLQTLDTGEELPEVLTLRMPEFLESCDMVKFARQGLDSGQQNALLETARKVVVSTDEELADRKSEPDQIASTV